MAKWVKYMLPDGDIAIMKRKNELKVLDRMREDGFDVDNAERYEIEMSDDYFLITAMTSMDVL